MRKGEMAVRNWLSGYSSVWLGWVLASTTGWVLGWIAGFALYATLGSMVYVHDDRLLTYVTLPSIGMALGMLQWLVLRQHLPRAGLWIVANLVGYLGAIVVVRSANALMMAAEGLLDDAAFFFIMGAVVGIPQWLVLRRHYAKSFLWVVVSTLWWLGLLILVANPVSSAVDFMGFGAIIGAVSGAATGFLLIWLMKERTSREIVPRQPLT